MNESKAYINYPIKEIIIVSIEIKELYISLSKNRKLVTIIEIIRGDRKKTLSPYIITLEQKIIKN